MPQAPRATHQPTLPVQPRCSDRAADQPGLEPQEVPLGAGGLEDVPGADPEPIADHAQLLAPTLIRSQVLSTLYGLVHAGEMDEAGAREALTYIRGLRMRLLGDRVLQDVAWRIAAEFGWAETFDAEYIALTRLQADALVTGDPELRRAASQIVTVAAVEDLVAGSTSD